MLPTSLADRAAARSYGFLASQVSEILGKLIADRQLPDSQSREVLESGRALLIRCAEGSRLAEGKPLTSGAMPSVTDIRDLRHALTTLEVLSTLGAHQETSVQFQEFADTIRAISQARKARELDLPGVQQVNRFFTTLSSLLVDDLRSPSLRASQPTRFSTGQRALGTNS
jgi:hypothetical protein